MRNHPIEGHQCNTQQMRLQSEDGAIRRIWITLVWRTRVETPILRTRYTARSTIISTARSTFQQPAITCKMGHCWNLLSTPSARRQHAILGPRMAGLDEGVSTTLLGAVRDSRDTTSKTQTTKRQVHHGRVHRGKLKTDYSATLELLPTMASSHFRERYKYAPRKHNRQTGLVRSGTDAIFYSRLAPTITASRKSMATLAVRSIQEHLYT
jgi:hypothetical protein